MNTGDELNRKEAEPPLFTRKTAKYTVLAVLALSAGMLAVALLPEITAKIEALRSADVQDPLCRLTRHTEQLAVPDIAFNDAEGRKVRLSDWRGQMVLLNLWATWCAPCKTELPSLDRLQAKLGGKEFTVLAVSTDRRGPKAPAEFFGREGITHLKPYNDDTGDAAILMKAAGLPLTIVLNENGQEIARLFGSVDWDSPKVIAQLQAWSASNVNGRATSRPSL